MSVREMVMWARVHRTERTLVPAWAQARRSRGWLVATALGVLVIAIVSVGIGSVFIPPLTTLEILLARLPLLSIHADVPSTFETILFEIRLPRVALVALTGAALASSGTAYQGLFRNPLADPYLIGVASGAGLGAIGVMTLRVAHPTDVALWGVPLGAFAGALITVALVYALARVGGSTPTTTLILAGVAVGAFAAAMTTFILLRAGQQMMYIMAFLLGGYGSAGWDSVIAIAPFTVIGFALMYLYARPLNLFLFDEEQARQLGIPIERVKLVIVVAATLTTAAAVAFSGLIGFVGLIVPHAARLVVGPDHRRLLPLAALGGAGFLMLADLIARTVIAPEELPLGVVTAFAGAPFFLYLLRRAKNAAFF
jgi:cobalamin transport system permease protein